MVSSSSSSSSYKLYASSASFRAFAPLIVAEYNGVDVEVIVVAAGAGGPSSSAAASSSAAVTKSPTGKLPLLECPGHDGALIFSSHAISRYLAGIRTDTGLLGSSTTSSLVESSAAIDAWLDWTAQQLELPGCVWFYPVAGYLPFNVEAYEKAKVDFAAALKTLEGHLAGGSEGGRPYLVDGALTLADIVVASTLLYPFKLVCDPTFLAPFPHVVRWFRSCVSAYEFQQVVGQVTMCKKELKAPAAAPAAAVPAPAAPAAAAAGGQQ